MFVALIFGVMYCTGIIYCINNKIDLVVDYTLKQTKVNSITGFLCLKKDNLVILSSKLHKQNIAESLHNTYDFTTNIQKLSQTIFVLDMSCNNSRKLLNTANNLRLFKKPFHWFLISDDLFHNDEAFLEKMDIFADSRVVYVKFENESYNLSYIYKIGKSLKMIWYNFAVWNTSNGFIVYEKVNLLHQRQNFRRYPLNIGYVINYNETFNHMTDGRLLEQDTVTKICYRSGNFLLDFTNSTLGKVYVTPKYAEENINDTDNLKSLIQTQTIDFSVSPLIPFRDRVTWLYPLAQCANILSRFIFRQPPLSYVNNIFYLPFDSNLWMVHMVFVIFSSVFLFIVILWEWKIINERNQTPENDMIHPTFSDATLFTIGVVCQQGYATEPKGLSGKILILTLYLTLIFLFTAYTAYIVVLFQSTSDDIQDIEDLYKSNIDAGLQEAPYVKLLTSNMTGYSRKLLKEKIEQPGKAPKHYEIRQGIEKMRTEFFAFNTEIFAAFKIIEDTFEDAEKCGLKLIQFYDIAFPTQVCNKNSPFAEIFRIGYTRMTESGLTVRESRRILYPKPVCLSQGNVYRSAGLIDLKELFLLLIIGMVLSLIIILLEIIYSKYFTFELPGSCKVKF